MAACDDQTYSRGVRTLEHSETTMARTAASRETLRRITAAALAHEPSLRLAESIRTYASQSRANGDSIHEVLEVLMNLARDTAPQNASSAKRSCDIAEWAIAGYFDETERDGHRVRRD